MNVHATLSTESKDAGNVAKSLGVDNVDLSELKIETLVVDGRIVSEIEAGGLGTMLATLDDLIACQITAEEVLD